jgi:hypothetical protein
MMRWQPLQFVKKFRQEIHFDPFENYHFNNPSCQSFAPKFLTNHQHSDSFPFIIIVISSPSCWSAKHSQIAVIGPFRIDMVGAPPDKGRFRTELCHKDLAEYITMATTSTT